MANNGPRSRRWCITLPYETDTKLEFSEQEQPNLLYAVCQIEEAPETRYLHWQGYCEFDNPIRLATIKEIFGDQCHGECAKGDRESNRRYCTKEETRWRGCSEPTLFRSSRFQEPKQGSRADLADVKSAIDEGASLIEVADKHFPTWIRHCRAFERYYVLKSPRRTKPAHTILLWGDTSTGKSRWASKYGGEDAAWKPPTNNAKQQWYDGYHGNKCFIWDEFEESQCMRGELLRMLDWTPFLAATKGGFTNFAPETIIITTNEDPDSWYGGHLRNPRAMPAELRRRIHHIVHLTQRVEFPDIPVINLYENNNECTFCADKEQLSQS